MGFFSKLRAAASASVSDETTARAILGVTMIAAAADGSLDDNELTQIGNLCLFNPLFHSVGAKRSKEILHEVAGVLRAQKADTLLDKAVAVLTPKQAETAMCFAVRVVLADGRMQEDEIATLVIMSERLGVPQETFKKIVEVMIMLQRRG